ncbi:MAG: phosphatase PAP2 family protein [Candidatus Omnitrophota bacterium]
MPLLGAVRNLDIALFNIINRDCANAIFDTVMPVITSLGSGKAVFIAAIMIALIAGRKKKAVSIILLAAIPVAQTFAYHLKMFFALPRPGNVLSEIHLLVHANGYAFPSGHTTMICTAATILAAFFRSRALFLWLAAAVGVSRIYTGAHFPSDVLSGALLGTGLGYGMVAFANYTGFLRLSPESGAVSTMRSTTRA